MKYKPNKIYVAFLLLVISGFSYATWMGYAFYNDKVEKNTEYKGARRGVYIHRFYHK